MQLEEDIVQSFLHAIQQDDTFPEPIVQAFQELLQTNIQINKEQIIELLKKDSEHEN